MRECVQCNQEFEPKHSGHFFCSDQCRHSARGGEYRRNRELALRRDDYQCTQCASEEHLECHHKVWLCKGGDHRLSNLQTLCRSCHKEVHRHWRRNEQRTEQGQGQEPKQATRGTGTGESEGYDNAA